MSNRLEYYVNNYEKLKIGVDEPFKFNCTMCGKCCINREDILLNAKDIYNLTIALEMTAKEVIDKYCDCYIGDNSRLPLVRLKPVGPTKRCPLLKGNRCSVHTNKPIVCAMFPIGRAIKQELSDGEQAHIDYLFSDPHCGDRRKTHTVREWFDSFGIPLEDKFFFKWQEVMKTLIRKVSAMEKKLPKSAMSIVWSAVHICLYEHYDQTKEFLSQFEENTKKLYELLDAIELNAGGESDET